MLRSRLPLKADPCQGDITFLGLPDAALSNIVAFLPVEDVVRLSSANHCMQVFKRVAFHVCESSCVYKAFPMQEIDRDDEIWRGRVADDFLCSKSLVRVFLSCFRLARCSHLHAYRA
jgi:hypothetical protein